MRPTSNLCLWSCLVALIVVSCKKSETTAEQPTAPAVQEAPAAPAFPALGNQDIADLYSKAEKVDIIFYKLPISVNQEDPSSVKNTVMYVTPAAPQVTATCEPLGRLSWMANGVILREADVFCGEGCTYLQFMKDNQPYAVNALSPGGVAFFNNIISQVEKVRNGQ